MDPFEQIAYGYYRDEGTMAFAVFLVAAFAAMGIRNADLERRAQPWYKRTASPVVLNGSPSGCSSGRSCHSPTPTTSDPMAPSPKCWITSRRSIMRRFSPRPELASPPAGPAKGRVEGCDAKEG